MSVIPRIKLHLDSSNRVYRYKVGFLMIKETYTVGNPLRI
jgi:hypothetical protein